MKYKLHVSYLSLPYLTSEHDDLDAAQREGVRVIESDLGSDNPDIEYVIIKGEDGNRWTAEDRGDGFIVWN
jgi:hypothetical protein